MPVFESSRVHRRRKEGARLGTATNREIGLPDEPENGLASPARWSHGKRAFKNSKRKYRFMNQRRSAGAIGFADLKE